MAESAKLHLIFNVVMFQGLLNIEPNMVATGFAKMLLYCFYFERIDIYKAFVLVFTI